MKIETMKKSDCCGCLACVQVCPTHAITFEYDEEGFAYPKIDKSKCISCGLCENACMFKAVEERTYKQLFYAAKSLNFEERLKSRSGGVFFVLAKKILENHGSVYGCIIDENQDVLHIKATDIETCKKMQGSKYVESEIKNVYLAVKEDLMTGSCVLFTGTACQVAGLYGYLKNKKYSGQLYTLDIVCHGVSSRKIYYDFRSFIERKYNGKIEHFNFRDKDLGWDSHIESYLIKGKKIYSRYYTRLFYSNAGMRPSCSNCPFASYNRLADITVADFWGLRNTYPEFDDNKGVSAVLINSNEGEKLFELITDELEFFEVTREMCQQPNLCKATPQNVNRDIFWDLYLNKGFTAVLKKFGGYDFLRRFKWKVIDLPKLLKVMKKEG